MKSKYPIAFVCMILSLVVTVQARSVFKNEEVDELLSTRAEELQINLLNEREQTAKLYEQLLKYKQDLEIYSKAAEQAGGYSEILAKKLEDAEITAGLTNVIGEGITVTLQDSKLANPEGFDENNFVIHDEDLLRVINEIRGAGAEAISLNGERILATSEISCTGATVSINNKKYSSPFVIKAIGNADEMTSALEMRQGVVDILAQWGIEVVIKKSEQVRIKAYDGPVIYKYASVEE